MITKIKTFFKESREEFQHVNWPTRQEAIRLTTIVMIISVGLAAFLGVFDFAFSWLLKSIITN